MTILIATGMRREARVLARLRVTVVVGGLDPARLEAELEAGVAAGARAILSMGLAGALAPTLMPGDWVLGAIVPDAGSQRAEIVGADAWIERLAGVLPRAMVGRIHADGQAIAAAADKRAVQVRTRAIAVDMESHVAARVAARHGLPFAVARVISDAAGRSLPPAVLVAIGPDGGLRIGALLRSILRRPWQIPALIGVAIDAGRAMRSLARGYDALARAGFALGDERQLPLDMA